MIRVSAGKPFVTITQWAGEGQAENLFFDDIVNCLVRIKWVTIAF